MEQEPWLPVGLSRLESIAALGPRHLYSAYNQAATVNGATVLIIHIHPGVNSMMGRHLSRPHRRKQRNAYSFKKTENHVQQFDRSAQTLRRDGEQTNQTGSLAMAAPHRV